MTSAPPAKPARLVITPGEPGGVGPELALMITASGAWPDQAAITLVADPGLLKERARALQLDVEIETVEQPAARAKPGVVSVLPVDMPGAAEAGRTNPDHAGYVLATLDAARAQIDGGHADALVTGPIQKSSINAAGIAFSGHTEYLAAPYGAHPVMMLAGPSIRVALVTTHLPLAAVPAAVTQSRVADTIRIVDADLRSRFGIARPRICVTGLNPHAGEAGHLGLEDDAVIAPAIRAARGQGVEVVGPRPADTAVAPQARARTDAYIFMFHDQGLPVVKALDFGRVVNITLGLPIIRTSVDHGTALDLAGTGTADPSSLIEAALAATTLAHHAARVPSDG